MSFDAGSIIAYLKLDKSDFDKGLAEALAEGEAFEKDAITIPIDGDAADFDKTVAAVEVEKAAVETAVTVDIDANPAGFEAVATAVEAEKTALATGIDIPVTVATGSASSLAQAVQTQATLIGAELRSGLASSLGATAGEAPIVAMLGGKDVEAEATILGADVGKSIDTGLKKVLKASVKDTLKTALGPSLGSLVSAMLTGGVEPSELGPALQKLQFSSGEIKSVDKAMAAAFASLPAQGGQDMADALAASAMPTQQELSTALSDATSKLLGGGSKSPLAEAAASIGEDLSRDLEDAIGAGGGTGGGPLKGGLFGGGAAKPADGMLVIPADVYRTLIKSVDGDTSKLTDDIIKDAIENAESGASSALGDAGLLEDAGGGGGGSIISLIKGLGAAGDAGDTGAGSAGGGGGGFLTSPGGLATLTTLLPVLGGLGLNLGGAVAGTTIGGAGTIMALLPGILDLMKGEAARTALSTGGSTAGMSASQLGLGKALGALIGTGSKGLGGAEKTVMPDITKFIGAITTALPSITAFGNVAVTAMGGFFGAIDKGVQSAGFKSFMKVMTKDLKPIMQDFGKVILNMGSAFGSFLLLFGGKPAQNVGSWFVKMTGEFATWMAHVKLSPQFIQESATALGQFGKVVVAAFHALRSFLSWLEPIGATLLTVGAVLATRVIPAVLGVTEKLIQGKLAVEGLHAAMNALNHLWSAVWKHMKGAASDAWHWLDRNVIQPLSTWFTVSAPAFLTTLRQNWKHFFKDIHTVAVTLWGDVVTDVFDPIQTWFTVTIPGFFTTLSSDWSTFWGSLKGFVKTAMDDIATLWNKTIGALHFKIPGWVPVIGGDEFGVPQMPMMANGGYLNAGQSAIVGEEGPEIFTAGSSGTITPNSAIGTGGHQVTIYVDARGATQPGAVEAAAQRGIATMMPALQAALARGAA